MYSRYKIPRRSNLRAGFSLVELMAVIVILGILATVATVSVKGYLVAAKQGVARTEIASICNGLDTFDTLNGRYPSNEEGIEILAQPSERFPEPILKKVPKDPWGNPYQYIHPGQVSAYEVICLGQDGREGGTGADKDISSDDDEDG